MFWLPDGTRFWVYSNDRKHGTGAFTSENNKGGREDIQGFATGLVYGEQVTLEYYVPKEVHEIGVISVAYVVHGYRYILIPDNFDTTGYGESLPNCHNNVNCPEGQPWQSEKKAVAMIFVDGIRWCSGSLINTTAKDLRPLFPTANYCLALSNADAIHSPNLNYWSFYWHYESPSCVNAIPSSSKSTSGTKVVANNTISDFSIFQLTENQLNTNGIIPYFLGWDCSGNAGTSGVGIHHPTGDIKKISFTYQIQNYPYSLSWVPTSIPDAYWQVYFSQQSDGTMEGGSSGSPLINNSHRVIGQLRGGTVKCAPTTFYYGKFNVSWTGSVKLTVN